MHALDAGNAGAVGKSKTEVAGKTQANALATIQRVSAFSGFGPALKVLRVNNAASTDRETAKPALLDTFSERLPATQRKASSVPRQTRAQPIVQPPLLTPAKETEKAAAGRW